MRDLDLGLLRTFVSVVDAGGFTRGAERVHRTQSTVSQQIQKLEQQIGRPLLMRTARSLDLTDDGERLLGYARKLLYLADDAIDAFEGPTRETIRIGLPEDYAVARLPSLLGDFSTLHPTIRLDVRCDLSIALRTALDQGDLDLILIKETTPSGTPLACWQDTLFWACSADRPLPADVCDPQAPVPLVAFPQGCVYRNRAIHMLESRNRRWRIAYTSPSLAGIQAAVAAGLGLSVLSTASQSPGVRALSAKEAHQTGFPPLPAAQRVLYGRRTLSTGAQALARMLIDSLRDTPDENESDAVLAFPSRTERPSDQTSPPTTAGRASVPLR